MRGVQGRCSFAPTAVPSSPCHREMNRPSPANCVITRNPLLVRPSVDDPHATLVTFPCPSVREHGDRHSLTSGRVPICPETEAQDADKGPSGQSPAQGRPSHTSRPDLGFLFKPTTQVTEKCPACGHPEAFYEEKQVGCPDNTHTRVPRGLGHHSSHISHRCVAQTRDPRFSTP